MVMLPVILLSTNEEKVENYIYIYIYTHTHTYIHMVFPVVMCGCESGTIKKVGH